MTSIPRHFIGDEAIDITEIAQIIYKCKFCEFITDDQILLISHYRATHLKPLDSPVTVRCSSSSFLPDNLEERFVCSLCYFVFLSRDIVKQHMIDDHGCVPMVNNKLTQDELTEISKGKEKISVSNFKTDTDREFAQLHRPTSLRELQSKLKSSFVFKCAMKGCSKRFETEESRAYHEKCHNLLNNEFKCFECQMVAKTWRNCSSHLYKQHKIDVDLLKCPFCAYKAHICVQIFRHLQVHYKGFACSNCPKIFKQFSQLRVHGITHHQNEGTQMRWYSQKKCEICSNMFANSKVLSKHIKTVHNQIKPFICSVCGHKSARKVTHMVHLRQHTGEKPIVCQYCKFKAADPSVIKKHELRHQNKDQWKYKCKDCNYTSIQSSTIKSHLKKYHPKSYKDIQCDLCSFVSMNINVLNRHKNSHLESTNAGKNSNNVERSSRLHHKSDKTLSDKPNRVTEVSSDCFLPLESTDSISHDHLLDTGGVTIPENQTEETQFPTFISD